MFNSTSQPKPLGSCVKCGGQLYEGLHHQCHTTFVPCTTGTLTVDDTARAMVAQGFRFVTLSMEAA